MLFFTADTHFHHKRAIPLNDRPFKDVDHMNSELIRRWNNRVTDNDTVVVLGDFCLAGVNKTRDIISQLNGEKILILGNHDVFNHKPNKWVEMGFRRVKHSGLLYGFGIAMSHYPYAGQEHDGRKFELALQDGGMPLLHGHVHKQWTRKGRMFNVGVDVRDYEPKTLEELL